MSYEMAKCKITVIKRVKNQDLADLFLKDEDMADYTLCDLLEEGQEFVCEHPFHMPEGFPCQGAWADIRNSITAVAAGMELPWIKQRHTTVAVCNDWLKPVYFKIEKM